LGNRFFEKRFGMKLQDMFKLNSKIALVIGGGRGIGIFIATGLAEAGGGFSPRAR
jgi:NADP-dependent 3-hydroxy acid dehydrogenase YdfG